MNKLHYATLIAAIIYYAFVYKSKPLDSNISVNILQGKLIGSERTNIENGTYYAYKAIPYAKPPIGKLRFQPPQPHEGWKDTLDARNDPPICYQINNLGQEDCLYLNVYTKQNPVERIEKLKPVMFYIHGGGFYEGNSREELYNSEFLMTEDIVLVVVNYRLGLLGFLNLNIDIKSGQMMTANAGLKDQAFALKWVQENIRQFGGDPNLVTIFGQSAGAACVHLHLFSPLSRGLFHKAIIQSGGALMPWAVGKIGNGQALAEYFNLGNESPKEILEYLQGIPVKDLLDAQTALFEIIRVDKIYMGSPIVEDDSPESFLPESPEILIKTGRFSHVPIMMGYTDKEGMIVDTANKMTGLYNYLYELEKTIAYNMKIPKKEHAAVSEKIKQFYFNGKQPTPETDSERMIDLISDLWFGYGSWKSAKMHAKFMAPVYFYRFSADTKLNFYKLQNPVMANSKGACHVDELGYIFKTTVTPKLEKNSLEMKLLKTMVSLWTNFAKYSNPTPHNVQQGVLKDIFWIPVNPEGDDIHYLEIGNKISLGVNPDKERLTFWRDITKDL